MKDFKMLRLGQNTVDLVETHSFSLNLIRKKWWCSWKFYYKTIHIYIFIYLPSFHLHDFIKTWESLQVASTKQPSEASFRISRNWVEHCFALPTAAMLGQENMKVLSPFWEAKCFFLMHVFLQSCAAMEQKELLEELAESVGASSHSISPANKFTKGIWKPLTVAKNRFGYSLLTDYIEQQPSKWCKYLYIGLFL